MVVLVAFLQSAQDRDGACRVRFVYHNRLETAFERLVFLEILLVFIERSGSDASQFAAGQSRFQNVGRIHCAFSLACSDQSMDFVDKQDDVSFRLLHFVDDRFQTFFKFALILGSCNQRAHIQRVKLLVFQVLGHIPPQDTLGKSFHNGCFTRTRLSDQNRVVFGSPAQDLEHTADFFVTSDNRIELSVARCLNQVDGVFVERLIRIFARL